MLAFSFKRPALNSFPLLLRMKISHTYQLKKCVGSESEELEMNITQINGRETVLHEHAQDIIPIRMNKKSGERMLINECSKEALSL